MARKTTDSKPALQPEPEAPAAPSFLPSEDVIADVVRYVNTADGQTDLKLSIKARLDEAITASGIDPIQAVAKIRETLVEAGIDKRRVSEVLIDLGFRSRRASAAASEKADALAAELADLVETLVALAEGAYPEEPKKAISALRRAHLKLQGRHNGSATAEE